MWAASGLEVAAAWRFKLDDWMDVLKLAAQTKAWGAPVSDLNISNFISLQEIEADIRALEQETEGPLEDVLTGGH